VGEPQSPKKAFLNMSTSRKSKLSFLMKAVGVRAFSGNATT